MAKNKPAMYFVLTLFCVSGDPAPAVSWWRDGQMIDASWEETYQHTVSNTLSIPNLGRDDVSTTLTCLANNNNISVPAAAKVVVDMKCKLLPKYTYT